MSNFAFLKATLPELYRDAASAESYVTTDPRSACFYSRRTVELLVNYLYEILNLPPAYRNDLAARINDSAFKAKIEPAIGQKLNLIRKLGNDAAHTQRTISRQEGFAALRELHHVMVWAAFHHSVDPTSAPVTEKFDPARAAKAAPLSREEVTRLAQKFQEQDEKYAAELAARDDLVASHEAKINKLQEQIRVSQAAKTEVDTRDYDEEQTRINYIDQDLRAAGWSLDAARDREYQVTGMPNKEGTGFVDYVLWGADNLPLAMVEAKRATKSPAIAQQQAKLYADRLEARFGRRPVIFYSNGDEHWIWDDASGYPPREVQGFYTRDELELIMQRRHERRNLETAPINTEIAGRYYQERAIRAVNQAFERKEREALLVMATGSGKTRTAVALVDQMMKAGWVKNVLFLADRTALVKQAANAFNTHAPATTPVNLVTNRGGQGRVYVSTYPTMMNLINEQTGSGRRFGPGYFDLIVIDEAHRSVYAKYGAIFDWFDGLLLGLTATPKDEIDHNTYRLFNLEDGVPTDAYSLEEAVADGYLVPPKGVSVGTKFMRQGIKYDDLSDDEKADWDALDWGEVDPPDQVDSEALNRFLFNADTVDKVLATLMEKGHRVSGGDRLGKTIIFAKNQHHAEFIQKRFDVQYPEFGGTFARTITHSAPYSGSLIEDFYLADKAPHIAISVDMLDTGIDVAAVVNLVFFKTVHSKSKFWQMIGRGTRLCPDLFGPGQDKTDFLVFDFCGNLEYFSQDLPGAEGRIQKSLSHRLFENRVKLVRALGDENKKLRRTTSEILREFITGMNPENFLVRPKRRLVEKFSAATTWQNLTQVEVAEAIEHLAHLPSAAIDADEDAKRFDLLVLRRQLAQIEVDSSEAEAMRERIQAIAEILLTKTGIPMVAAQAPLIERVSSDDWWVDVTLGMLEQARVRLRGLIRLIEITRQNPVYADLQDELTESSEIEIPGITPGTDFERFRAKATDYLRQHEDHVALQRLRRNKQLTQSDLEAFEEMLTQAGGNKADLIWASSHEGGLGVFIRGLIGLERSAVLEAFTAFLDNKEYSVNQLRFVELIIDELTANGVMEPGRLFESPYIDRAPTGPEAVFSSQEVGAIIELLNTFQENAKAPGA